MSPLQKDWSHCSRLLSGKAQDIWKQFLNKFERESTGSILNLRTQLLSETLKANEDVHIFNERIIRLSERLRTVGVGDHVSDTEQLCVLLKGLSSVTEWKPVAIGLQLKEGITFTEVSNYLQDFQLQNVNSKSESVNYVRKQSNSHLTHQSKKPVNEHKYCKFCKKKGHVVEDCDRRLKRCHHCKRTGHIVRDCYEAKKEKADSKSNESNESNKSVERSS